MKSKYLLTKNDFTETIIVIFKYCSIIQVRMGIKVSTKRCRGL